MYSCGHNQYGENVPEYWELLPHRRMPCSSGECSKCRRENNAFMGMNVVVSDQAPKNALFFISPRHNPVTGELDWEATAKASVVITNLKEG